MIPRLDILNLLLYDVTFLIISINLGRKVNTRIETIACEVQDLLEEFVSDLFGDAVPDGTCDELILRLLRFVKVGVSLRSGPLQEVTANRIGFSLREAGNDRTEFHD